MKIIAHRGNVGGRQEEFENKPDFLKAAIDEGYDVEIDVWIIDEKMYFGHDEARHYIYPGGWPDIEHSWFHAKNLDALELLLRFHAIDNRYKVFFHDKDPYTIVSNGTIWTYPGHDLTQSSIAVLPESLEDGGGVNETYAEDYLFQCYGICTDMCRPYKELLELCV